MKTTFTTLFFLFIFIIPTMATHNRAGEIAVRQLDDLTIEVSVFTYTKLSSVPADRDTISVNWGDGNIEQIPRVNGIDGDGEPMENDTKKNIYQYTHTYSNIGSFLISVTDPNRNAGILNINAPLPENVPFHIQTEFTLVNMTPGTINTSPTLLEAPVDIAFLGQPFVHVPNAFDLDGDSLSYSITTPLYDVNLDAPNYQFPTSLNPGPNNIMFLDPVTGVLTWTSPQFAGEYVVAILITSYRNGQETDRMIRDMQILVKDENELASQIAYLGAEEDVVNPVSLGDTVRVTFDISEPDMDEDLFITSTCGLYNFYNNNATFETDIIDNTGTAVFEWVVKEEHLRQFPYQLVVQASGSEDSDAISSFAVFRFRTTDVVSSDGEPVLTSIKAYPNPAKDLFFIETDLSYPLNYLIIDSKGSLLRKGVITEAQHPIDISSLSNGYYYIQLFDKNQNSVQTPLVISR